MRTVSKVVMALVPHLDFLRAERILDQLVQNVPTAG